MNYERQLKKVIDFIGKHLDDKLTLNMGDTVYRLYRDWLPTSGEELGNLPCIFFYYNFDHEVAETELITECWLLLK